MVPVKPNIAAKSNYASRPSIPSSQKESATEFNLIVSSIQANYERLILDWNTDIVVNTTLPVGQYVLYLGTVYRIDTAYSVGSPLTWDASKATPIGGDSYRGTWSGTTAFPSTGGRFTGGVPLKGDRWKLTAQLVVGGNVYDPGTIVEAAVNNAGATTLTDWNKYAMQL